MTIHYAPYLTTSAGACLTQSNWRELGIHHALCGLAQMVIKPGLAFWQHGMDLKTYLAWDGVLILDARDFSLNEREEFVVLSPYDGSRVRMSLAQFWDLVHQLKPDKLLLPPAMDTTPPQANLSLKMENLGYQASDGFLLEHDEQTLFASDRPAQDALQGVVYHAEGYLSLQDPAYALDFQVLQADCVCPTCQSLLTRAYLHYLLQSTPLLCHRFLMMHNVHWIKRFLS
jgi:queuine tRNA-ribosyltransferase